jgi:protein phosphatase 1 regulatory subunit 11
MLHPSGEHHVQTATAPPSATTQTSTATPPLSPSLRIPARAPDGTLRLRGGPIEDRRVRWDQDVIDNEGMGKKKSKGKFIGFELFVYTFALMPDFLLIVSMR